MCAGYMYSNGSQVTSGSSYHAGDVITVIVDVVEDKISFEINGTLQAACITGIKAYLPLYPAVAFYGSSRTAKFISGVCTVQPWGEKGVLVGLSRACGVRARMVVACL